MSQFGLLSELKETRERKTRLEAKFASRLGPDALPRAEEREHNAEIGAALKEMFDAQVEVDLLDRVAALISARKLQQQKLVEFNKKFLGGETPFHDKTTEKTLDQWVAKLGLVVDRKLYEDRPNECNPRIYDAFAMFQANIDKFAPDVINAYLRALQVQSAPPSRLERLTSQHRALALSRPHLPGDLTLSLTGPDGERTAVGLVNAQVASRQRGPEFKQEGGEEAQPAAPAQEVQDFKRRLQPGKVVTVSVGDPFTLNKFTTDLMELLFVAQTPAEGTIALMSNVHTLFGSFLSTQNAFVLEAISQAVADERPSVYPAEKRAEAKFLNSLRTFRDLKRLHLIGERDRSFLPSGQRHSDVPADAKVPHIIGFLVWIDADPRDGLSAEQLANAKAQIKDRHTTLITKTVNLREDLEKQQDFLILFVVGKSQSGAQNASVEQGWVTFWTAMNVPDKVPLYTPAIPEALPDHREGKIGWRSPVWFEEDKRVSKQITDIFGAVNSQPSTFHRDRDREDESDEAYLFVLNGFQLRLWVPNAFSEKSPIVYLRSKTERDTTLISYHAIPLPFVPAFEIGEGHEESVESWQLAASSVQFLQAMSRTKSDPPWWWKSDFVVRTRTIFHQESINYRVELEDRNTLSFVCEATAYTTNRIVLPVRGNIVQVLITAAERRRGLEAEGDEEGRAWGSLFSTGVQYSEPGSGEFKTRVAPRRDRPVLYPSLGGGGGRGERSELLIGFPIKSLWSHPTFMIGWATMDSADFPWWGRQGEMDKFNTWANAKLDVLPFGFLTLPTKLPDVEDDQRRSLLWPLELKTRQEILTASRKFGLVKMEMKPEQIDRIISVFIPGSSDLAQTTMWYSVSDVSGRTRKRWPKETNALFKFEYTPSSAEPRGQRTVAVSLEAVFTQLVAEAKLKTTSSRAGAVGEFLGVYQTYARLDDDIPEMSVQDPTVSYSEVSIEKLIEQYGEP